MNWGKAAPSSAALNLKRLCSATCSLPPLSIVPFQEAGTCFYEYEEPLMAPNFYPTYKKLTHRVGGVGWSWRTQRPFKSNVSPSLSL